MKYTGSSKQLFEFEELYFYNVNLIKKIYIRPNFNFFFILIDNLS